MLLKFKAHKIIHLLLFILISRFTAEFLNSYVYVRANYLWSVMILGILPVLIIPALLIITSDKKNLFKDYTPILLFLFFLIIRTRFGSVYSIKCALSELIVWSCFILTLEICRRDASAAEMLEKCFVYLWKFVIMLGVAQFLFSIESASIHSVMQALNLRKIMGIFDHPNTFLICTIPFMLYFLKRRQFGWLAVTFITCVFTGTRGPFFSLLCLSLLVIKSFFNKPIRKTDIVISFMIVAISYTVLIYSNRSIVEYEDYYSRNNAASLQWRVNHWKKFLEFHPTTPSFWFGHRVGAADQYPNRFDSDTAPFTNMAHNDYLRMFWDLGMIGLLLFLNMIFSIIRLLYRNIHQKNDFILTIYLVIVCFLITDNLIYFTYPVFIFMFIAALVFKEGTHGYEDAQTQH